MAYQPKVGDIIKMHSWHGVVLDIFKSETGGTVLRVQTARNVFRSFPPEFIQVDLAPDAITPASREELDREIAFLQEMRELGLQQMLSAIQDGQANREVEEITPQEYADLVRLLDGLEQPAQTDMELYEFGGHRDLYNYLTRQMGLSVEAGRGPVWYRARALVENHLAPEKV